MNWVILLVFIIKYATANRPLCALTYVLVTVSCILKIALVHLELLLVHAKSPWTRRNYFEMQFAPGSRRLISRLDDGKSTFLTFLSNVLLVVYCVYYSVCVLAHLIVYASFWSQSQFRLACLVSWNFVHVLRKYTPPENIINIHVQLTMSVCRLVSYSQLCFLDTWYFQYLAWNISFSSVEEMSPN